MDPAAFFLKILRGIKMNFDQWKKLPGPRQRKIAKSWDLQKGDGREIATAVLRVFIGRYGSNKGIGINSQVIRLRDNAGWGIGVQCFNESSLRITPEKYMGIAVSRFHIDHIEDSVFFPMDPAPKLWQRPLVLGLTPQQKIMAC